MQKIRPPQPDTPSCLCTTAGCSTQGDTLSTRTADMCPPYRGDRSQPVKTQHRACHVTTHTHTHRVWHEHRSGFFVVAPAFNTLCIYALAFFWCYKHYILLASHFPFSHALSCSCVSREMFPETERQAVSQLMATESNYRPLQYRVHGDGVLAFFPSRYWNVNTISSSDPLAFITTEKRNLRGRMKGCGQSSVSLQPVVMKGMTARISLDDCIRSALCVLVRWCAVIMTCWQIIIPSDGCY